jgi:hypothetical protein
MKPNMLSLRGAVFATKQSPLADREAASSGDSLLAVTLEKGISPRLISAIGCDASRDDIRWCVLFALLILLLMSACTKSVDPDPTRILASPEESTKVTSPPVARPSPTSQVVEVVPTQAITPTEAVALPTQTLTATEEITGTSVCAQLAWIADVTVPDGTVMDPGEIFFKIWRIENTGTCAWSFEYQLAFDHGDQLSGPDVARVHLFSPEASPQPELGDLTWKDELWTVNPGELADVALFLKAPDDPGVYSSVWLFSDEAGIGIDFLWVEIAVEEEIVREENDWTGEWTHVGPSRFSIEGHPLVLSQTGDEIFGYFYTLDGRVMLVEGKVLEEGSRVDGHWGEPFQEDLRFQWFRSDDLDQFTGTYKLGNFGSGKWCAARGDAEVPAECIDE